MKTLKWLVQVHTAIEDFGFPTLFKDIGGTIKIYEDESNTVSIEY